MPIPRDAEAPTPMDVPPPCVEPAVQPESQKEGQEEPEVKVELPGQLQHSLLSLTSIHVISSGQRFQSVKVKQTSEGNSVTWRL